MKSLTQLIHDLEQGDLGARDELFAVAYKELKKLAHSRLLRDGGRNTVLETTSLVHDSYLRFIKSGQLGLEDRRAFFSYASKVMHSVIIDSVRERQAERRGGKDLVEISLDSQMIDNLSSGEDQIMEIHEALKALAKAVPRLATVVEMRYFGGYTEVEIAETLGVQERTVRRDWEKAQRLLKEMLQK